MNIFKNYPNKWFVETGTCCGGGVDRALEAGFQNIRSIELGEDLHVFCRTKFKGLDHIKLYLGDSTEMLYQMIQDINEPITFFLDGHNSGGITHWNGKEGIELISELYHIKRHPVKTHTILIDDYRGYKPAGLEAILFGINPEYTLKLGTYHEIYPNDVLIATI